MASAVDGHHDLVRAWVRYQEELHWLFAQVDGEEFASAAIVPPAPEGEVESEPARAYIQSWNVPTADRLELLAPVWGEEARQVDPGAEAFGPDGLSQVIDDFDDQFPRTDLAPLVPTSRRSDGKPGAWTWSSYRDCLGLSAHAIRDGVNDAERLHSYVSSDPSVGLLGSDLPSGIAEPDLEQLRAAVSEWLRVPMIQTTKRTSARRMWLGAARAVVAASDSELARRCGVNRSTVSRTRALSRAELAPLLQIAGDSRFPGLL
ncbi:MAG: hypothetical protein ACI9VR_005366 [Cognaticolwellia sp.]